MSLNEAATFDLETRRLTLRAFDLAGATELLQIFRDPAVRKTSRRNRFE